MDGLRRVRKVYVQVAKKNAKSTLCGVLSNFHLFADKVQTPKVFTGANNEDQAKICVNIAGKIIEQSEDLYQFVEDGEVDLFKYKENIVNIVHRERDGFIKAMAKEPEGKERACCSDCDVLFSIDHVGDRRGENALAHLEVPEMLAGLCVQPYQVAVVVASKEQTGDGTGDAGPSF